MHSYISALQFTIFFILIWRTPLSIFLQSRGSGDKLPSFLFSCLLCVLFVSQFIFLSFILQKIFFSGKMFLIHRFPFLLLFFSPLAFWNMSFHSLLAYKVSFEKSTQSYWEVGVWDLYTVSYFPLLTFKSLSLSSTFDNLIMCLGVVFFGLFVFKTIHKSGCPFPTLDLGSFQSLLFKKKCFLHLSLSSSRTPIMQIWFSWCHKILQAFIIFSLLIGSFQITYVWVRWFFLPLNWVCSCSLLHFFKTSFLVSFSSRISLWFFYQFYNFYLWWTSHFVHVLFSRFCCQSVTFLK